MLIIRVFSPKFLVVGLDFGNDFWSPSGRSQMGGLRSGTELDEGELGKIVR